MAILFSNWIRVIKTVVELQVIARARRSPIDAIVRGIDCELHMRCWIRCSNSPFAGKVLLWIVFRPARSLKASLVFSEHATTATRSSIRVEHVASWTLTVVGLWSINTSVFATSILSIFALINQHNHRCFFHGHKIVCYR